LVDIDPQANATSGVGLRLGEDHKSVYHSLINDEDPAYLIRPTSVFGLDIFPSSPSLAGANVELIHTDDREFRRLWESAMHYHGLDAFKKITSEIRRGSKASVLP